MQIITTLEDLKIEGPSAIAIGKFDGIHRGHQLLITDILMQKKKGMKAVVFTFAPSPLEFLTGKSIPALSTQNEKRKEFDALGIDVLIEFPMNAQTAATLPEDFIREYLINRLAMSYVAAGTDLSYGDRGKGDYKLLQSLSETYNYQVELVHKVCENGVEISSSRIRDLIEKGDMVGAKRLLGMPYSVSGRVVHGKQLGRMIGMPTVNILPEQDKLLPPRGVYYSEVEVNRETYLGITNIGLKPTVSSAEQMGVETYLYNFEGDLYEAELKVNLLEFKRPEMRFADVEALTAQMRRDMAEGAAYHGL